jgi:phosphodiesterase/alkaline phosphatase D-like protein
VTFTYSNDVVKEIKECGVVYFTEEVEATEMTKKTTATVSATDSKTFTVNLEGLESNKRYYYYVYTKFGGGISYKGRWDFTTKAKPTIDDNVSPSKKD